MKVSLGRHVKAPDGTDWIVGRAWLGKRRPGSFRSHVDGTIGTSAWSLESLDPTQLFDGEDFVGGLIVAAVAVAFVLLIIPIILFGIELIIVGCVLAIGVVGSAFLGRPWTVVAKSSTGQVREWRMRGRRASAALIDRVCTDIQASGQIPTDLPETT